LLRTLIIDPSGGERAVWISPNFTPLNVCNRETLYDAANNVRHPRANAAPAKAALA